MIFLVYLAGLLGTGTYVAVRAEREREWRILSFAIMCSMAWPLFWLAFGFVTILGTIDERREDEAAPKDPGGDDGGA